MFISDAEILKGPNSLYPNSPSVLKIAKVIPIHKKAIKSWFTNYRLILTNKLTNIEKIIEKPMYKRLSTFLDTKNLIYLLQFGFQQKH